MPCSIVVLVVFDDTYKPYTLNCSDKHVVIQLGHQFKHFGTAGQGLRELYLPFNDVVDVALPKWLDHLQAVASL